MAIPFYNIILSTVIIFSSFHDNTKHFTATNINTALLSSDSLELVKLFNATNGGNWTSKWDLGQPLHTWDGVEINVEGCVVDIQLSNNNLVGSLPDLSLPTLESFDVSDNSISGGIPDFNFPQVKQLRLGGNGLTGTVPDFLNMPLLELLGLVSNKLDGTIPDFSNLSNLTQLFLGENLLSGGVPNFTGLPKLQLLDADFNQLDGEIPDFDALPDLAQLSLNNNSLSGNIPGFSNMPLLDILDLRNNLLDGTVPSLAGMPNLQQIGIAGNNLDSLPDDLPAVDALFVRENRFTFDDLLPYKDVLSFPSQYVPQDSVSFRRTEFADIGDYHEIDLGFDDAVTTNIYTWFKNGQPYLTGQNQNKLVFNVVDDDDEGVYQCRINNTGLSHLTLVSYPITLVIAEPLVIDSMRVTNTRCLTGGGSIRPFASGGLPPYLYSWDNGGNGEVSNGLYAGLYAVTISDAIGQVASDSAEIIVDPALDTENFVHSGDINCNQDRSILEIAIPSFSISELSIIWTNEDNGEIIGEGVLSREVEEGFYGVFVYSSKNECEVDYSWEVKTDTVRPNASIITKEYFPSDNTVLLAIDPLSPNLQPNWETPNGDTYTDNEIIADQQGIYEVTVTNTVNGCSSTTSRFIELVETPNAFTPNGDGVNDLLIFPVLEGNLGGYPNNELIVFNRWNDIIYKAKPYLNDWDGIVRGRPLPEGTYYFILRLKNPDQQIIKGDLTILR